MKRNIRTEDNIDVKLAQDIGRLEGKIDMLNENIVKLTVVVGAQNGRIGKLERKEEFGEGRQSGINSFWKTIVIVLTLAVAILGYILKVIQ